MLWFLDNTSGKRVTKEEFHEAVIPHLRDRGLSQDDIRYVRAVIDGDLNEDGAQNGISEKEINRLIDTLKQNAPDFFSDENLQRVEDELRHKL
ncbi:MAG: hypothetical protein WAT81_05220 [Candidatus Moraniibacteriota bacterium]